MSKYKQQKIHYNNSRNCFVIWRKPCNTPDNIMVLGANKVSKEEYDSHKEEHGIRRGYACQGEVK